jgi:two-component system phosphate regulon sensor histidine kinase PhoR
VLLNLVDNALKYGGPAVEVTVGARRREEDGPVEVWVKDNGPGIAPEHRERIFERFYRVDRARSREQGGTGLGLSIVKHIVQSHGGEVWVNSEVGRGSTFCFTLPPTEAPD